MLRQIFAILVCTLCLAACERTGRLYPMVKNPAAHEALTARFKTSTRFNKTGPVELTMPDGEILTGNYQYIMNGKTGFGKLFSSVYGAVGAGSVGVMTYGEGGGFGTISLSSDTGTSIYCEFYDDFRPTGSGGSVGGFGVCKSSHNISYKLKF